MSKAAIEANDQPIQVAEVPDANSGSAWMDELYQDRNATNGPNPFTTPADRQNGLDKAVIRTNGESQYEATLFPFNKPEIPEKVNWIENDPLKAYERAAKEGKPLIIMFHADWCNYCKKMDTETLQSPAFRQFANDAVFLKLDVEKDDSYGNTKNLMTRLGVTEYPAISILDVKPDSVNLRGRIIGYHTPVQFMGSFRTVMPKAITDKHPNDPGLNGAGVSLTA